MARKSKKKQEQEQNETSKVETDVLTETDNFEQQQQQTETDPLDEMNFTDGLNEEQFENTTDENDTAFPADFKTEGTGDATLHEETTPDAPDAQDDSVEIVPIALNEIEALSIEEVEKLEANGINSVQQLSEMPLETVQDLLELSEDDTRGILDAAVRLTDAQLVKVKATRDGDGYLPGMEPVVSAQLKKLGDRCKVKRDDMQQANKEYREAKDLLIEQMRRDGVKEYELDTGETVSLTDTFGVKIKKNRADDEMDNL